MRRPRGLLRAGMAVCSGAGSASSCPEKPHHANPCVRCPATCRVVCRYQQNPLTIDLVGEENTGRLADTIRLLVQQVEGAQKMSALQGVLSMYGNTAGGGKAIIFVNTKVRRRTGGEVPARARLRPRGA